MKTNIVRKIIFCTIMIMLLLCVFTSCSKVKSSDVVQVEWTWNGNEAEATVFSAQGQTDYSSTVTSEVISVRSCTSEGRTVYTATFVYNGVTYTDRKTVVEPATGHAFGDWIIEKQASCSEEGAKYRVCANDPTHIERESIAKIPHTYGEWVVTQEATETENGTRERTCSRCGHVQEETFTYEGTSLTEYSIEYRNLFGSTHTNPTVYTRSTNTITLTAPTERDGYTFIGWFTESTFVNEVTEITYTGSNVVLYAKWSETTTTATTEMPYMRENSYIYFGAYPQTKVTDSAIMTALTSQAGTLPTSNNSQAWTSYGYYIDGSVSNFMWYIDLEYNGEKYRGVYFTSYRPYNTTTSSSTSNSYQDDNGYYTSNVYWFKYEPIKWRILSEESGEALILCEMIIDSQNYYITSGSTRTIDGKTVDENNYQYSTIRAWLNDTFYNTAFTDLQKAIIQLTTVDNSARSSNPNNNATQWNSGNNTYACANTEDYIFLLSEQEVTTGAYGFNADYSNFDTVRRKKNTDYAKCQGVWTSTISDYLGNGYWWLRSPRYDYSNYARYVHNGGGAYGSDFVYDSSYGVVPALKIRL